MAAEALRALWPPGPAWADGSALSADGGHHLEEVLPAGAHWVGVPAVALHEEVLGVAVDEEDLPGVQVEDLEPIVWP